MGVWIGGVWDGHFPEPEKYISVAEFSRKSLQFCRKSDFCQISGSEIWKFRARKIAIPYPQPYHTPTRLPPSWVNQPLVSNWVTRTQLAVQHCPPWRKQGNVACYEACQLAWSLKFERVHLSFCRQAAQGSGQTLWSSPCTAPKVSQPQMQHYFSPADGRGFKMDGGMICCNALAMSG